GVSLNTKFPDGDNTYQVAKVVINLGEISDEYFSVISGVNQGDYIAIAGLNNLFDGTQVQLFKN
ncbi:MAG: efflux transporter periplasmic adaptor subunit, partial [Bacteroidota bacterium]